MSYEYSENILVQESSGKVLSDKLGWEVVFAYNKEVLGENGTLGRKSYNEIILVRYLKKALFENNEWMTDFYADEAVKVLCAYTASATLMQINEEKYSMLRDGIPIQYKNENGTYEPRIAKVFNFAEPEKNYFLAVKEMKIHGDLYRRRTDIVGFVNGIPLLFIELKKQNVDVKAAYDGNYTDYLDTIPQLFRFNAFLMLSNGLEAKVGTLGSKFDFFHEWKRLKEDEVGAVDLETMLLGICEKKIFMDLFENFILFDHSGGKTAKILARNHQYLGVNEAVESYKARKLKDGKLGVFWHTQGSGKSYSMVFLAQKIRRKFEGSPTFVILTDRDELNKQISDTFEACGCLGGVSSKEFIPQNGKRLIDMLRGNPSFIFTLIQKFNDDSLAYANGEITPEHDIIILSDEAHRSQNGIFADNMCKLLPTASRLGRHRTLTLECIDKLKLLGVRVISVTENIDSFNDEDDLLIGFKGLINDSYSKDIQRKVIYGFRQKQQKGLVMIPPMGYFKDKNTNEIVIVEEPAEIVRTIFKLYLEGYGLKAIARILNEKGMKSPAYYQLKLIGKKQGYNKPKITSRFLWDYSSVKRILQNEFYCGTVVNHRNERSRITKKQVAVPAEEQYRHENMVPAIVTHEMWERVQEFLNAKVKKNVRASESKPCHKYAGLLECSDCGCSFVAKIRKTKGNPDRVEYVCNGYHRYSEVNCTSHRIREEMLDKIVQAELEGIRLVFNDLWENVENDVKKWAAGKSTTEKRLENLKDKISGTELEIQKILMERIEDKQNADMYDKMIESRRDDIEKFKKEVYEIENLDKTIKERKSTLKHSIELLDDIIAENNISNANLHLMFDKIIIEETDEGLNLDLRLKSPFISKAKEPLLKKYMIVDNEILQEGA